jgi:phage-related baseplate assembly protein
MTQGTAKKYKGFGRSAEKNVTVRRKLYLSNDQCAHCVTIVSATINGIALGILQNAVLIQISDPNQASTANQQL